MEQNLFKKSVNDYLLQQGFEKKRNYYYLTFPEIIIVIGFQKSNHSNAYYINLGYVIVDINSNSIVPKDVDGDIRARFSITSNDKKSDLFEMEVLTDEILENSLKENLEKYVRRVNSIETLKSLVRENPIMLLQTKLVAKKLLEFE